MGWVEYPTWSSITNTLRPVSISSTRRTNSHEKMAQCSHSSKRKSPRYLALSQLQALSHLGDLQPFKAKACRKPVNPWHNLPQWLLLHCQPKILSTCCVSSREIASSFPPMFQRLASLIPCRTCREIRRHMLARKFMRRTSGKKSTP